MDGNGRDVMEVDGKQVHYCGPLCECPEDAIIGRSLISCADIVEWIQKADANARAGNKLVVQMIEGDPDNIR